MKLNSLNCGVYQITCKITGDSYIGTSNNLYGRIGAHLSLLKNGNHRRLKGLQLLWNTHGVQSFEVIVLEVCDPRYLLTKETKWINKLNPTMNKIKETNKMGTSIKVKQESTLVD